MAFVEQKLKRGPNRVPVTLSVHKMGHNGTQLRISVAPQLAEQLGWKPEDPVEIAFGMGQDEGYVRVGRGGNRKLRRAANSDRFLVMVRARPDWPLQDVVAPDEVRPDTLSGRLTIRLPWTRARKVA